MDAHLGLVGKLLLDLGLLLSLSLLLLGDLLDVELVGKLLLVNSGTKDKHDGDDDDCGTEDAQVIDCGALGVVDSQLKIGPPMETLEAVEQKEHTNDLEPVGHVVFVNGSALSYVTLISGEVSTVFHGLREVVPLRRTLLNHLKRINYF